MKILVLNAGSSSQKSAIYEIDQLAIEPKDPIWEGLLEWSSDKQSSKMTIKTGQGIKRQTDLQELNQTEAVRHLLKSSWSGDTKVIKGPEEISRVGHRVVHGGERFKKPTWIIPEVKETIHNLAKLAPLHNPANLAGIEIIEKVLPNLPQVAVFDTAFHSQLVEKVYTYAGPISWREEGIRKYGFHGISHQYCAERAAQLMEKKLEDIRILSCHLGNGCSLAAIQNGCSKDTTMGFTPMEGLMMGTRSGSIDPGILFYLQRKDKITWEKLENCLNYESGLKGICGDNDMREVLKRKELGDGKAKLAFDMYVHSLQSHMGAMIAVLGGLDAIIYTAGIGVHSGEVRRRACEGLSFFGVRLDEKKNEACQPDQDISEASSGVRIFVIQDREDWAIAQATARIKN